MTAGGDSPERVLAVWCPGWPEAGQETGTAGDDAGPDGGAAPGAGQGARRAPEFGQVVSVVEGFCPRVEVLRPGACAIGVRGPARYFGGEGALAAKIIDAVAGGGVACRVGIADGLFAARLAAGPARHGQDARPASTASPVVPGTLGRGHVSGPRPGPGVPGPVPGQRAGRPRRRGSGGPSPPAGHRDAGRVRLAAGRRCGQPVRGAGSHRPPAGARPGPPAAGPPPAIGRPFGFGRIRPARPPGRARGVRRQGAGRADA